MIIGNIRGSILWEYKREYLVIIGDNLCQFCTKTYVVTPHLIRLDETVQMRGHNIWFQ